MEIQELILILLIGFGSSFVGAIAGSGSMIVVPLMIILGIPAQIAIATDRLGAVGFSLGAFIRYVREKKVVWRFVLPLTLVAIIGGIIGARFVLGNSDTTLTTAISVIILISLPLVLIRKKVGVEQRETSVVKRVAGYGVYFFIMAIAGFFMGASGTLTMYALMYCFGLTTIQSSATRQVPLFFLSLITLLIFMANGKVDYLVGVVLFLGTVTGSFFGARTALKKGERWVRTVLVAVTIISALKLLFF